jgi:hypothetical protein
LESSLQRVRREQGVNNNFRVNGAFGRPKRAGALITNLMR